MRKVVVMIFQSAALNIGIIGNVASGKTTLTQLLSTALPDACYVPEPFEQNPFLPLYLRDQPRWGFTNGLYYFWDYARIFSQKTAGQNYRYHFIDAGTWTNRWLYGEYMRGEGIINADEYAFYQALCDIIERDWRYPQPDGFILVEASPASCWQRMHRRGWAYQTTAIEITYLEKLDHYLTQMKQRILEQNIPLLTLSSDELDFTQPDGQAEALDRAHRFLDSLHQPANP
jgi:deoxyadenosine/deoxycytidine kinase